MVYFIKFAFRKIYAELKKMDEETHQEDRKVKEGIGSQFHGNGNAFNYREEQRIQKTREEELVIIREEERRREEEKRKVCSFHFKIY